MRQLLQPVTAFVYCNHQAPPAGATRPPAAGETLSALPELFSFIHSFGLNNKVQDIKVTKTLTYVLGLNTKHQNDIVR